MRRRALLFILFCVVVTAARGAPPKDLVQPQLLTDVSAVQPGQPFTLGVMLKIKPEWHIYWINPGDAGLPTRMHLKLPEGFSAGEVLYPVPVRFEQPGGIVGNGYHDEVMLLASVTPPSTIKPGETIHLAADVSWLCCENVCVQGTAELTKDLAVAEKSAPANEELFARWRAAIPKGSDPPRVSSMVVSSSTLGAASPDYEIRINWKQQPPREIEWFPVPGKDYNVAAARVRSDGSATYLSFKISPLVGKTPQAQSMPSVLAYTTADGKRVGLNCPVPLRWQTADNQ